MRNFAEEPTGISSAVATHVDFCQALQANIKPLYLLAFLLTTNHEAAEQCFFETVEVVMNERRVFREWVNSWIKRSLIKAAISKVFVEGDKISSSKRVLTPNKEQTDELSCRSYRAELEAAILSVTHLCSLDRFVFVMSILEDYSVRECALLLNCSLTAVLDARANALLMLPVFQGSEDSGLFRELHRSTPLETIEIYRPHA